MQHNSNEIGQPWQSAGGLYLPGSVPADLCHCTSRPSAGRGCGRRPDGRVHLCHDISNALDALARGCVDCLDDFRPARSAIFWQLKHLLPMAQVLNDRLCLRRGLNKCVRGPLVWARQVGDSSASDRSPVAG
eukprot:187208-Chlamydomonas_euryale.AAC.1